MPMSTAISPPFKIISLLAFASLISHTSAFAQANPPTQQKITQSLAATCANCHGTAGNSVGTRLPRLAGQPEADLLAALKG